MILSLKGAGPVAPVIATIVQWLILPSIMLAVFAFAWVIAGTAKSPELKVSAWAGFFAGLVIFVIYVVSQLRLIHDPDFRVSTLPGLLVGPLSAGLGAGFLFLWLVRVALPTRLVGILTLMLAGTSSSALFTYLFLTTLRIPVLYWTLGTALGILLHVVFFPGSVRHIFGEKCGQAKGSSPPRQDTRSMEFPFQSSCEQASVDGLAS
jgi:hypothetical protein